MKQRLLTSFFIVSLLVSASFDAKAKINHAVNLAGEQRLLTQKLGKQVAMVALGINKDESVKQLKETIKTFDKTINGLLYGDKDLKLEPIKSVKVKKQLEKVFELWFGLYVTVNTIAEKGEATKEDVTTFNQQNSAIFKEMNKAVKFMESKASSEVNPALVKAINYASKKQMLTHKIIKEYLMAASGNNAPEFKKNLSKSLEEFDDILNALKNGDDSKGISKAPTEEINTQLNEIENIWTSFKAAALNNPSETNNMKIVDDGKILSSKLEKLREMFVKL